MQPKKNRTYRNTELLGPFLHITLILFFADFFECLPSSSERDLDLYLDLWSGVNGLLVDGDNADVEQSRKNKDQTRSSSCPWKQRRHKEIRHQFVECTCTVFLWNHSYLVWFNLFDLGLFITGQSSKCSH